MNPFDELPLRDELRARASYFVPELDVPVRLAANESPYQLPNEVADAVEKSLHAVLRDLNRYPDPDALALREDLASYLGEGLSAANVWAANGANEIHQQLLQAFAGPGRNAMGFEPSYEMHEVLATNTGTSWLDARRTNFELTLSHAKAQVRVFQPDVVFVCSPNNPTGGAVDLEVVEGIASEAPGMVIVDESYAEFARPGFESAVSLLPRFNRLVVVRSMSSAFGLAGVRIGYLVGSPLAVEAMRVVRVPYHLSSLSQAAARAALAHAPALLAHLEPIRAERDRLIVGLRELGLTVLDSDANFVLFGQFQDRQAVWQALVERGVLVRDVGLDGWLRVSVGSTADTTAFLAAMGTLPHGV
jgi:histidinol-phosphate aminotransferase